MDKLILLVIVLFVTWIIKLVNQNQAKGQGNAGSERPVGPPRDRRVQNEIDDFLKEIGGGRKVENVPDDDIFIEIVQDEERIERQQQRRVGRTFPQLKPLQPQPATLTPVSQPPKHQRPGSGIEERKGPGSTDLGGGVREHVSEHMQEGMVAEHVQEHLAHDVNKSVTQHLGISRRDRKAQQQDVQLPKESKSHAIVQLLHKPSGMRQAILLSEILSPPKGLRRSS